MNFQKEITFLSQKPFTGEDGNSLSFQEILVTKTATFKELNRTDKKQHKLHFKIVALFTGAEKNEETGNVVLDSDTIYDLTVKSINELLQVDKDFTEQDKNEFLKDSGAIFNFGYWFLGEKVTPFFSSLMNK